MSSPQIVAQRVTSDPVPAVVGTAISGSGCRSPGSEAPSRKCLVINSRSPRRAVSAIMPLAASMTLPPPTATRSSTSESWLASLTTSDILGLAGTPAITLVGVGASPTSAARPRPSQPSVVTSDHRLPATKHLRVFANEPLKMRVGQEKAGINTNGLSLGLPVYGPAPSWRIR
jgi:hypothetical protein